MEEPIVLTTFAKIIAIVAPICAASFGGFKWVVKRVEDGQYRLQNSIEKQAAEHRKDILKLNKKLAKRVSVEDCEKNRSQCPCNLQAIKGK